MIHHFSHYLLLFIIFSKFLYSRPLLDNWKLYNEYSSCTKKRGHNTVVFSVKKSNFRAVRQVYPFVLVPD